MNKIITATVLMAGLCAGTLASAQQSVGNRDIQPRFACSTTSVPQLQTRPMRAG